MTSPSRQPTPTNELLTWEQHGQLAEVNTGNKLLLDPKQVFELGRKGCSVNQTAALLGVSKDTILYNYYQTWYLGRAETYRDVMTTLIDKALNDEDIRALDIVRKEFSEKDAPQVQININSQVPVELKTIDIDELNDL